MSQITRIMSRLRVRRRLAIAETQLRAVVAVVAAAYEAEGLPVPPALLTGAVPEMTTPLRVLEPAE